VVSAPSSSPDSAGRLSFLGLNLQTSSKRENEECEGDVFLSSIVAERNLLEILTIESEQCEIRSNVAYFQLDRKSRLFLAVFFSVWALLCAWRGMNEGGMSRSARSTEAAKCFE
jgi:hypothetical protein